MTTDTLLHLAEIFIIGAPLWWSAIRLASILRDFPPHRHDNGHIIYPKGYEPGVVEKSRS
jgi:hypothetical protein